MAVVALVMAGSLAGTSGVAGATGRHRGAASSRGPSERVIVVLKDQLSATPDTRTSAAARKSAATTAQSGVVRRLTAAKATHVHQLTLIDAVVATVGADEAQQLAADPSVAEIVPDGTIRMADPASTRSVPAMSTAHRTALPGACAPKGQVQLNPEAVEDIHAASDTAGAPTAQGLGYTGSGVKVGIIADGLDVDNPDLVRADGSHVVTDYRDFTGEGLHAPSEALEAFLDASSVVAQGRKTYDVSDFGSPHLRQACKIRILGVAPGASLVALKAYGASGVAYDSVALEAIDYAVTVDHVNVLSESFGENAFPDTSSLSLIDQADEAAVAAGVTVVSGSGDGGPTDTLISPGNDPEVLDVGASTTFRLYDQIGLDGVDAAPVDGWLNDNISSLSSAGEDQTGGTVSLVAPGDTNWALCTADLKVYTGCSTLTGRRAPVQYNGGTSESTPLTAGVAALVIQAYAGTHGGQDPSPAQVRQIVTSTADDIGVPGDQQGTGLVDAYQAVRAAASAPGSTGPAVGDAVLDSSPSLQADGQPGATETLPETLTNTGSAPESLHLSSRTLGSYSVVSDSELTVDAASGNKATTTFVVPPGQSRLDVAISYPPTADANAAGVYLFSPDHDYAGDSIPMSGSGQGDSQVTDPEAGTWTAVVLGYPADDGGSIGSVELRARTATWSSFGSLSTSSVTLPTGGSATFDLTVDLPSSPGDVAGSVVVSNDDDPGFTGTTSIPVTLRSDVPDPDPTTTFSGTVTGGNGRNANAGQGADHEVDLPAGLPALDADITTPDAGDPMVAMLVDPTTGEAASTATNGLLEAGTTVPQAGAQLHVVDPAPGVWTLVIDFYDHVSGSALDAPFTVTMDTTPVPVDSSGLPDDPDTTLTAGQPTTVDLSVTNVGSTTEQYFTDARTGGLVTLPLTPLNHASDTLPDTTFDAPEYLVPPGSTSLTASVASPSPVTTQAAWAFGTPFVASAGPPSDSPSVTLSASTISPGTWAVDSVLGGPFGRQGVAPVQIQAAMDVTTLGFDPAMSTTGGDLWEQSTDPTASFTPVDAAAGQTVVLPVTIVPSGSPGTVVSGTLYVDVATPGDGDYTDNADSGTVEAASEVVALPYEYTIG